MNEREAIYVAALLEGEGFFGEKRPGAPRLAVQMTDEDIVRRLHEISGVGNVSTHQPKNSKHKRVWTWQVQAKHDAAMIMLAVYPYMGHRRQKGILEVLARYEGK